VAHRSALSLQRSLWGNEHLEAALVLAYPDRRLFQVSKVPGSALVQSVRLVEADATKLAGVRVQSRVSPDGDSISSLLGGAGVVKASDIVIVFDGSAHYERAVGV